MFCNSPLAALFPCDPFHFILDQRILYYNAMIKQTIVGVSTSADKLAVRVILNADTRAFKWDVSRLYVRVTQTKY